MQKRFRWSRKEAAKLVKDRSSHEFLYRMDVYLDNVIDQKDSFLEDSNMVTAAIVHCYDSLVAVDKAFDSMDFQARVYVLLSALILRPLEKMGLSPEVAKAVVLEALTLRYEVKPDNLYMPDDSRRKWVPIEERRFKFNGGGSNE